MSAFAQKADKKQTVTVCPLSANNRSRLTDVTDPTTHLPASWLGKRNTSRRSILITVSRPAECACPMRRNPALVSSIIPSSWTTKSRPGSRGVCIENLIRFECLTESLNVSDHGRTVMLLSDAVGLAVQIE